MTRRVASRLSRTHAIPYRPRCHRHSSPYAIRPAHHLAHLRAAGLAYGERSGKCIEYEAAAPLDRVRYQRRDTETTLKITARGGGLAITIHVPMMRETLPAEPSDVVAGPKSVD